MRSTTAPWQRLFVYRMVALVVLLAFNVSTISAQQPPHAGAPGSDISNIPKTVNDTVDRINARNNLSDADVGKKASETEESCLLPPLSQIARSTVAAGQLQIKPKARKEYHQACVALKNKNTADAERHLRKAV